MAKNIRIGQSAVAGGTVDALTITLNPALTPYNTMPVFFRSSGPNLTTTPTANVNGDGAKTITKKGGEALVAGDIDGDHLMMYDLPNTRWELLNPASDASDTYWQAGAGDNSLMDKRSTESSGESGFAAGNSAVNSGVAGQAIGYEANNSGGLGQAIGAAANNSVQGQAIGAGANNSGDNGQAIGDVANNSGTEGQAIGAESVNVFARSTALGHQSITTADDQMNLAQTLRLQAYTGGGIKLLQHDDDGIVTGSNTLPSATTATTQSAGNNSTSVATTAFVKTAVDNKSEFFGIACSDETTVLAAASTSVPVATMHVPYAMTLTKVYAGLRTAGTGAAVVTVDIHVNGTTIMSATKILFTASQKLSADGVLTTTALAAGDYVEIFLDQRDTDNVATGLKTYLVGHQ